MTFFVLFTILCKYNLPKTIFCSTRDISKIYTISWQFVIYWVSTIQIMIILWVYVLCFVISIFFYELISILFLVVFFIPIFYDYDLQFLNSIVVFSLLKNSSSIFTKVMMHQHHCLWEKVPLGRQYRPVILFQYISIFWRVGGWIWIGYSGQHIEHSRWWEKVIFLIFYATYF